MVLAEPDERETCPYHLQFASLYDGQEVLVWSNCLLDLDRDFLVGNVVFVRDVQCLVPLQVNKSSAQCSSD